LERFSLCLVLPLGPFFTHVGHAALFCLQGTLGPCPDFLGVILVTFTEKTQGLREGPRFEGGLFVVGLGCQAGEDF
jgi:hypothetical protein